MRIRGDKWQHPTCSSFANLSALALHIYTFCGLKFASNELLGTMIFMLRMFYVTIFFYFFLIKMFA